MAKEKVAKKTSEYLSDAGDAIGGIANKLHMLATLIGEWAPTMGAGGKTWDGVLRTVAEAAEQLGAIGEKVEAVGLEGLKGPATGAQGKPAVAKTQPEGGEKENLWYAAPGPYGHSMQDRCDEMDALTDAALRIARKYSDESVCKDTEDAWSKFNEIAALLLVLGDVHQDVTDKAYELISERAAS